MLTGDTSIDYLHTAKARGLSPRYRCKNKLHSGGEFAGYKVLNRYVIYDSSTN